MRLRKVVSVRHIEEIMGCSLYKQTKTSLVLQSDDNVLGEKSFGMQLKLENKKSRNSDWISLYRRQFCHFFSTQLIAIDCIANGRANNKIKSV